MKLKELKQMLTIIGTYHSTRWSTVMAIVKFINDNKCTIKEKKWDWDYKNDNPNIYPLDLSNIKTWSTYDGTCISLDFTPNGSRILCDVRIYDGDSFDGHRKKLNFTATLSLPNSFLKVLEDGLKYSFDDHVDDLYENHLMLKKEQWMDNCKLELLG